MIPASDFRKIVLEDEEGAPKLFFDHVIIYCISRYYGRC